MLLEACKYVAEEKYMPGYITDNVEFSSGDSDREDSNKEKNKKRVILKTFLLYIYIVKLNFVFQLAWKSPFSTTNGLLKDVILHFMFSLFGKIYSEM